MVQVNDYVWYWPAEPSDADPLRAKVLRVLAGGQVDLEIVDTQRPETQAQYVLNVPPMSDGHGLNCYDRIDERSQGGVEGSNTGETPVPPAETGETPVPPAVTGETPVPPVPPVPPE